MKKVVCCLSFIVVLMNFAGLARAGQKQGWPIFSVTGGGYTLGNSSGLDGQMTYGAKLGYEINGETFAERLGIEAVYQVIDSESEATGKEIDVTLVRFDLLYLFKPLGKANKFQPFLTLGAGGLWVKGDDVSTTDPLVAYGIGGRYFLTDYLALRADLRQNLVFASYVRTDYEYTLGLTYRFGVERKTTTEQKTTDRDKDGVLDNRDKCAGTPEGLTVDKYGCPVNAPDSDGDTVPDYQDDCPNTPDGLSVDDRGCFYDDDDDGVPNERDRCPSNPPGFQVDENGCTTLIRRSEG